MARTFQEAKSRISRYLFLGAVGLAVAWWLAGAYLPGAFAGTIRFLLVAAYIVAAMVMAFRIGGGVLQRRRREMASLADAAGYSFDPTPGVSESAEFLRGLNHFALFAHECGVLGKYPDPSQDRQAAKAMDRLGTLDVTNRISGKIGAYPFQVFDYRYSPHEESKMAQRTTVFLLTLNGAALSRTRLIPFSSVGRLGKWLTRVGGNEVDLSLHPGFGRRFILHGEDEAAARALFSDELIAELERIDDEFPNLTFETAGHQLLVYEFDSLADGERFQGLLLAARRVGELLSSR